MVFLVVTQTWLNVRIFIVKYLLISLLIKRFFCIPPSIKSDVLYLDALSFLVHVFCQTIQNYLDLYFYKRNLLLITRLPHASLHICIVFTIFVDFEPVWWKRTRSESFSTSKTSQHHTEQTLLTRSTRGTPARDQGVQSLQTIIFFIILLLFFVLFFFFLVKQSQDKWA